MKGKKVNIEDISDFVLHYCFIKGITINHLKLQKLLYYIQAWHLVYFDENPLFDEKPEAWVNGPVYRKVYDKFKTFPIYNEIGLDGNIPNNDPEANFQKICDQLDLDKEQIEFLNAVLDNYAVMHPDRLVFLTHNEAPWNEARKGLGPFDYSDEKISHKSMFEYYQARLKQA